MKRPCIKEIQGLERSRLDQIPLATAIFPLGETILAINRTIPARLERNFAFLVTICASRLVHLSRSVIVLPAT